jgi:cardiolipin synthase
MPKSVPRRYRRIVERYVAGHRVTLLRNGERAFPAMLEAIDAAKQQVLMEMYWFGSDRIGQRFADALIRAARRGVEVGVIYDSLGSIETSSAMFARMEQAGVRVLEFNPTLPWHQRFNVERMTRRDHRKFLAVDGALGFTGGINIADHWLPEDEGGRGWRDDVVRIEGPAVAGFLRCFRNTWEDETGGHADIEPLAVASRRGALAVQVLAESTRRHRREIVRAYLYHIYRAHRRVWIANPYFVPDARITRALVLAALRGVDVRVLAPGKSDVEVVRLASHAIFDKLMAAGVRIYEWQKNVLHSKTAVIDGEWSTIGTLNLDYRSLRMNLEVNVAILDPGFAELMERSYLSDLEHSVEVDPRQFRERSLPKRLVERALYQFKSLL